MTEEPHLTVLIIPEGGRESRTLKISRSRLRWLGVALVGAFLLLTLLIGSWWYLMIRARQADLLEERVRDFLDQEEQIASLVQTIEELEAAYEQVRALFGADRPPSEVWLPSPGRTGTGAGRTAPGEEGIPSSWPLTERGFITQNLIENPGSDHPGVDIAIPAGSYIRAAGEGAVVEAGEDPVYGHYLVLEHGREYRSLYAHASILFVTEGDTVRRNEIVGLSGSSGRSTAPHLHFEILRSGEPIDPLTLVTQP